MTNPPTNTPTAEYQPSSDACLAFLEAAVSPTTDGTAPSMQVALGLQAAVATDGVAILRYLLGVFLSVHPVVPLRIALTPAEVLGLMGLQPVEPIETSGEVH